MPRKLLLADDSITIQRVIELTFADEDVEVIAVNDGQQAIDRIKAERPDIVLADVMMPERDGYEVASAVKSDPDLKHIPVVLLTGAFEPVDEARARAIGCDGVLVKPFEPQMVINRVRDLLAGERPASLWATPPEDMLEVSYVPMSLPPKKPKAAAPDPGPGEAAPPASEAPLSTPPAKDASLDAYFDKLDEAFGTLGESPAPPSQAGEAPPSSPLSEQLRDWTPEQANEKVAQPIRLSSYEAQAEEKREPPAESGATPPEDMLEVSYVPMNLPPKKPKPAPRPAPVSAPGAGASGVSDVARAAPSLADAFAALLAAEQGRPAPAADGDSASALATERIVADVARRVLDQMSDRVVHDTVADIVSRVAERLVREEISRIKANTT